jgi:MoxR-like ATPase
MLGAEQLFLRKILLTGAWDTVVITGYPGTGKTFFAEKFAEEISANFFYVQCTRFTENEIIEEINPRAFVSAKSNKNENAYQLGVVGKAALSATQTKTVLCIDEIDKAREETEIVLLDFLQNKRLFTQSFGKIEFDSNNLITIFTSNGQRDLNLATLRRVFRIEFKFLPFDIELSVLKKKVEELGLARIGSNFLNRLVQLANKLRSVNSPTSLYELVMFCKIASEADSKEEMKLAMLGCLHKVEEDKNLFGSSAVAEFFGLLK